MAHGKWKRREILKAGGLVAAAAALPASAASTRAPIAPSASSVASPPTPASPPASTSASPSTSSPASPSVASAASAVSPPASPPAPPSLARLSFAPQLSSYPKPPRPVTAIVLGAGNRGNVYASYARQFPDELKIVGVAEPIPHRRSYLGNLHGIPPERQWVTWEHALQVPKFADALIITTPDHLHYGPAMGGLGLDYDLLLEKVIAQSWDQCRAILDRAVSKGRIVAVCHVLRYTPYFRKLKEVVDSGRLGRVTSIQHMEPVEHVHMSHSFVRGNWRNSRESNPMILSKSCHDLDILRWTIGRPCRRVSSFGSLSYFRPGNAPAGAPARCTDGCPVEAACPFSALKIYMRVRAWLPALRLEREDDATVLKALREGPYGRCVFHCDNDVVDHQVTSLEFEGGVTAAFSMEALTSYAGRRTRVMGTKGDAVGDEATLTVTEFATGAQ
ncbi:MAG: Gfo/Idh/MocA family oxidoreductase, partial [Acidobacteriota bacterium]